MRLLQSRVHNRRIGLVVVGLALSTLVVAFTVGVGSRSASHALAGTVSASIRSRSVTSTADTAEAIAPVVACSSLASVDFTTVPGAPTEIASASTGTANGATYCDVTGYIAPQIEFAVDLPTATWTGDYLQEGCGGQCGQVALSTPAVSTGCTQVTDNELVLATDNAGHEGVGSFDGIWGSNDPAIRADFAYESENMLDIAAKAIIKAFYGRGPTYSYFDGCSTGGRQALSLAQRYPTDFNGILAGAPEMFTAETNAEHNTWNIAVNTNASGQEILTSDKLPALHAAVMNACANSEGVILDPRACSFNPASIQCPPGTDNAQCLTPAQVKTVRELYLGPQVSGGSGLLYPGGMPYGSELAWAGAFVTAGPEWPTNTTDYQAAMSYLKYLTFPKNPSASFSLADWKFTKADFDKLASDADLNDATDPNLTQFRDHGGKLIIYQGWADQLIPPFGTVAYYASVVKYMGGYSATQQFSRLYMIPAQYHCLGGGDPQVSADLLGPLIDWVEHGQAPGAVTMPVTDAAEANSPASLTVSPLNPLTPVHARGSLNDDYTQYIGKFTSGYELWCSTESRGSDGMAYVCSHRRTIAS